MNKFFFKKFLLVVFIVGGIVSFNNYFLSNFLQNLVYKALERPGIFVTGNLLNFSKYSAGFLNTKDVIDEKSRLEKENNVLRGQLAEIDSLKRENKFLRDELVVAGRLDSPLILVQIFSIQKGALSSTALINKGSKDGVKKSLPVITTGNVLVGIVEQVFDNSSLVLLLDDPRAKISGRIQDSRVLVDVVGKTQNRLGLDLVAVGDEVKEGDTVVTSGLDGMPEALLIADVTKVEISSGSLFKTVTAQPLFDPSLGSGLFVILK